jgi:hypothetical protein
MLAESIIYASLKGILPFEHLLGDFGIWYLIWYYVFVVNFESTVDIISFSRR